MRQNVSMRCLSLVAAVLCAGSLPAWAVSVDRQSECRLQADYAATVMDARLTGVAQDELVTQLRPAERPAIAERARAVITKVYTMPVAAGDVGASMALMRISSDVYAECVAQD